MRMLSELQETQVCFIRSYFGNAVFSLPNLKNFSCSQKKLYRQKEGSHGNQGKRFFIENFFRVPFKHSTFKTEHF